jgi:rfaE bifunctional protein nucleotidyltransferase chain/domain
MVQDNNSKIFKNAEDIVEYIKPLRAKGKKVVTTNGCFDILHAGHVEYLNEAALQGDILIVGVNSDNVVKKLKGGNRPVQSENDRLTIIAALRMVDCAFVFQEDDPREFIKIIRPDIHVKGGDYTEDIIEKPVVESYGGKISIVSFKQGYSSSEIINKIL